MNQLHHWLCSSAGWKKTLVRRVPWVLSSANLGPNVLEAGPGPGLTTDRLRSAVPRLTAIEADQGLAHSLRTRLRNTNVEVIDGDATFMPFTDAKFSACAAFTMLHHVPSPAMQDRLLREVWRVLTPGGAFVGCDSLQSLSMRVLHLGDTFVPIHPDTFGARLQDAGFKVIELEKGPGSFRFYALKPDK
ncbi:MAG: class I SAM-dependent methyltransferase [Terriglobales bacterium]